MGLRYFPSPLPWFALYGALLLAPAAARAVSLGETSLRGTIVFSDPRMSVALFEIGKGDLRTLRIGHELQGVGTLSSIEVRGVHFRARGVELEFTFNDSALATGGRMIAGAESASAGEPPESGSRAGRVDNPTLYVVPDYGQKRVYRDAEEASMDATPKPGQTIDETVWDSPAPRGKRSARP